MIQDQLKSDPKNQKLLRLSCYFCRNPLHLISQCPYFHFYPDRERVIKASEFSKPQKRMKFSRKTNKKPKFKVFLPRKSKEIDLGTPYAQMVLGNFEEISMKCNEKQDLKNNNNLFQLNLNNNNNNNCNEMLNFEEFNNNNEGLNMDNFESNNNISPIHKNSNKNDNKSEENSRNLNKNENQKKLDMSNFDDNESMDNRCGLPKFLRKGNNHYNQPISQEDYEPF